MTQIAFDCDRCGKRVEGLFTAGYTAGFYNVRNSAWSKYGREGEDFVCDECIQSSPSYREDYAAR